MTREVYLQVGVVWNAQILQAWGSEVNVLKLLQSQEIDRKKKLERYWRNLLCVPILLLEKRWALSENFAEFVQFVASFGVKDLSIHLQSAPRNVIYLSFLSVSDIMEKKTSNNFEQKLIDSLILEKKNHIISGWKYRCLHCMGDGSFRILSRIITLVL